MSQPGQRREPDPNGLREGHVNFFDRRAIVRLFGAEATLESFRCNVTLALVKGLGRYLPAPLRHLCYYLDRRVSRRLGDGHHSLPPFRNRDWLVVTRGDGPGDRDPAWSCPSCRGSLEGRDGGHYCTREARSYPMPSAGVPDLTLHSG